MKIIRDFGYWVVAVLREWYGWLGGSALCIILDWVDKLTGWNPSHRAYWIIASVGCVSSFFLAWRKERIRAEVHEAPEIMLNYRRFYPENVIVEEPLSVRNTGESTASRIGVEIHDELFRPLFETVPYLASGDHLPLLQFGIYDNSSVGVTLPSLGRHFITYLKMLKPEKEEQLVFRVATVSYENEHGIRFSQDFSVSFNVVSEESKIFLMGSKKKLTARRH
jgi:hypothetical protein